MSKFDRIEHFVVLMMENRSFDSVLGWLYEKGDHPRQVRPETEKTNCIMSAPSTVWRDWTWSNTGTERSCTRSLSF